MRKLISHMQVTVDGFMAGPKGELDWSGQYHDEAMWRDVWDLLSTVDTVLFGRVTYRLFEDYWPAVPANPSSTKDDLEFSRWIDKTPKIVASTTLEKVEWKNSRLLKGDVGEEVAKLKAQPGRNLLIFGSSTLASTLLKLGLIDELRTNVHPVVLGRGKPYFRDLNDSHGLKLVKARTINAGVVGLHYQALQ